MRRGMVIVGCWFCLSLVFVVVAAAAAADAVHCILYFLRFLCYHCFCIARTHRPWFALIDMGSKRNALRITGVGQCLVYFSFDQLDSPLGIAAEEDSGLHENYVFKPDESSMDMIS